MSKIAWLFFILVFTGKVFADASPFRFHLQSEPTTLSVYAQKNSSALYFLGQVTGTLVEYYDNKISGRLAEKCTYLNSKKIECVLKKNLKWSDGTNLTPDDFVKSFQKFIDPNTRAYRSDLLLPVKNAKKIIDGSLKVDQLGISVKGNRLVFELESPDSEFIYSLASPLLSPQKSTFFEPSSAKSFISTGPYKIKDWIPGNKIILENNPFYFDQSFARPIVEIYFISEDAVALNLYEKNELSFLRRLPTLFIDKFKTRKDYIELDLIRFDYIGFGPELKDKKDLREALSLSLYFPELQKLFSAKGLPGCPGIPSRFYDKVPCLEQNLIRAKESLAKLKNQKQSLDLYFSKQGGEDHKRATEWMQAQWRTNLGLNINLYQLENKIFVQKLESQTPALFRKGIGPDRPTCLSALEVFTLGNSEDYLKITDKEFQGTLEEMKSTLSESKKKSLCTKATKYLLDNYLIIPTGPMHFSLLVRPEFKGFRLNDLNQLDLSKLEYKKEDL